MRFRRQFVYATALAVADGFSDDDEQTAGTDPLDENSTPVPEPVQILLTITALLVIGALRRVNLGERGAAQ